ncbi:MAG: hypothetical protein ACPHX8_06880 [Candidatus Poseidoniaceae archaeon]
MTGYDINFNTGVNDKVTKHPLYQKYNMTKFSAIALTDVQTDLGEVLATQGSQAICAYLAWLIRVKQLLV